MKRNFVRLAALTALVGSTAALAHVSVSSTGTAGATEVVKFSVGHGCEGADTFKVRVELPAGVSSVRPLDSTFGKATLEKDASGSVKAVIWTKPVAEVLAGDTHFYELAVRMKLPNAPFRTVYFPTTQTCRDAQGAETVVEWVATTGGHEHGEDGGTHMGPNPAPAMRLMPPRVPGWNKYTVDEHVHDLPLVFRDALIVWSGNAAYSFNPTTMDLITREPDTQVLSEIHPGTEIWVKY